MRGCASFSLDYSVFRNFVDTVGNVPGSVPGDV